MKINNKDIGFRYTIGAKCDYSDFCILHPNMSKNAGLLHLAVMMNKAYNKTNGTEDEITVEELMDLDGYMLTEIESELNKAIEAGSKRKVETIEKKQGKATKSS